MNGKGLVFVVFAIIVLTVLAAINLGGDPAAIDRAKAERIEQQVETEARARAAAEARKQADWESTKSAVSLAKNIFFGVVGATLAFVLAVALLIVVVRLWQMSRSVVRAWSVYAEERARLAAGTIKVDRETRTWPALVANNAVHNLETGEVYLLGKARRADPQQAAVSGQVRALGVTAQAAERIGKSTKDAQAAEALPGLGASIPLVLPPHLPRRAAAGGDAGTLIVEQDTSETVDL